MIICCRVILNSLLHLRSTLLRSQNSLHECIRFLVVVSRYLLLCLVIQRVKKSGGKWVAQSFGSTPSSRSCSIQGSAAFLWWNGSSLPLCVTQPDWYVLVIGEPWDPHFLWWCLGQAFNKFIYTTASCYVRNRSAFNLNSESHPVMSSFRRDASLSHLDYYQPRHYGLYCFHCVCVCV